MYLPVLMSFGFALTTAIQPPIVPFVQQEPTPQWTNTKLGVYRFVNGVTGTALSVSDSSTDSLVVSMYVAFSIPTGRPHSVVILLILK